MRYELREYTDSSRTGYTVKATANDREVLEAYYMKRPSTPNDVWYRLHIVDTQENA